MTDIPTQVVEIPTHNPNDVPTKRNRTKMQDILDGYGPTSMTQ